MWCCSWGKPQRHADENGRLAPLLDISQAAHAMSDERSSALGTQAGAISRPLFYSFGLAGEWDPDDRLAGLGFEVHSFDPTERYLQAHRSHNVTGVHFHYTGLSTKASCQHSTSIQVGASTAVWAEIC